MKSGEQVELRQMLRELLHGKVANHDRERPLAKAGGHAGAPRKDSTKSTPLRQQRAEGKQ